MITRIEWAVGDPDDCASDDDVREVAAPHGLTHTDLTYGRSLLARTVHVEAWRAATQADAADLAPHACYGQCEQRVVRLPLGPEATPTIGETRTEWDARWVDADEPADLIERAIGNSAGFRSGDPAVIARDVLAVLPDMTPPGVQKWGVRHENWPTVDSFVSLDAARAEVRDYGGTLVTRRVTPWTPADGAS